MMRLLLCTALAACHGRPSTTGAETAPPGAAPVVVPAVDNVILITIDTLRADYLGFYGGRARTPVLDDLARTGWSFDRCFSASMLTNPSHASIMTSLYPRDHGVYDNESGIGDHLRTLAAAATDAGLRTGAVINFPHLNPEVANLGGFTEVVRARRQERRAHEVVAEGLELIDELGAGFFVWLHITDPHSPYEPPPSHPPRTPPGQVRTSLGVARRAAPGFLRKNSWFQMAFETYGSVEAVIERYIAEIEVADAGIGTLLDGLERRNLAVRTALVITSDHGENMGEHDLYFHHGGLYRETVHVPLVFSVPGATPVRVGGQVETVDIAPTVLELFRAPPWQPMRGRSLVGIIRGTADAREVVFSEHMLGQLTAVRGHGGTLILHTKSSRQFPTYPLVAGRREVFDRRQDPGETQNLGAGSPLGHLLGSAVDAYLDRGLEMAAKPAVGQDRESLRALGYIE